TLGRQVRPSTYAVKVGPPPTRRSGICGGCEKGDPSAPAAPPGCRARTRGWGVGCAGETTAGLRNARVRERTRPRLWSCKVASCCRQDCPAVGGSRVQGGEDRARELHGLEGCFARPRFLPDGGGSASRGADCSPLPDD